MYVHSVRILNFKSIGTVDNEVIIEPRITAIIGKNESGKSNLLEALACISPASDENDVFIDDNINRGCSYFRNIQFQIILKPKSMNGDTFIDNTYVDIDENEYIISGGLLEYFNREIRHYIEDLIESLKLRPFPLDSQEQTVFDNYVSFFMDDYPLSVRKINRAFDFFEYQIRKYNYENIAEEIFNLFYEITFFWHTMISFIPAVFYSRGGKNLKNEYSLENVKNELAKPEDYPQSLLSDLVQLIGIAPDDFIRAVESGNTGTQITKRHNINQAIKTIIVDEFNNFYSTEKIDMKIDFNSESIVFSVKSGASKTLLFSERGNGLRWYLNMFIEAKARKIGGSKILYLFDEPGISLHVSAQKELLKLFDHLAEKGNQIVYTTHSPYMLDTNSEGIHRIRAVEKDLSGNTHIYITAYDSKLSPNNQQDILAPLMESIGMGLYDTVGPAHNKLNIVTEGVSDYIYLTTMANKLGLDMDKYNIIPSVGVTNSIKLCSILRGWGCPFLAIFDYDREGVEKGGESLREHFLYEEGNEYIYLKEVDNSLLEEKGYQDFPYCIEDLVGKEAIANFVRDEELGSEIGKTLKAKLYCDAVSRGDYSLDSNCENRFSNLFERVEEIRGRLFKI